MHLRTSPHQGKSTTSARGSPARTGAVYNHAGRRCPLLLNISRLPTIISMATRPLRLIRPGTPSGRVLLRGLVGRRPVDPRLVGPRPVDRSPCSLLLGRVHPSSHVLEWSGWGWRRGRRPSSHPTSSPATTCSNSSLLPSLTSSPTGHRCRRRRARRCCHTVQQRSAERCVWNGRPPTTRRRRRGLGALPTSAHHLSTPAMTKSKRNYYNITKY